MINLFKRSGFVALGFTVFWPAAVLAADFSNSEPVATPHRESETRENVSLKERAAKWRLTESEYRRYLKLVDGPFGHWSENLDPVFVLGLFAEMPAEQRRYAELYAQQEYELVTRTIEFERAYRRAFKRLYPDARMVDRRLLEPYYRAHPGRTRKPDSGLPGSGDSVFLPGDRVLFFAAGDCTRCSNDLDALVDLVEANRNVTVDVYVLDVGSDREVRQWAGEHQLDVHLVGRRITLNADDGLYRTITDRQQGEAGRLFLSRGDRLYRIEPYQLRRLSSGNNDEDGR